MPHRNKEGQRISLPSLVEDDEEDELFTGNAPAYPSYRSRPSMSSAPSSSRTSRNNARATRPNYTHSSSATATLNKGRSHRVPNLYSQFNSRHRKPSTDPDDANSLYFFRAQDSDSDEEDLHPRRVSSGEATLNAGLDVLTGDEDVEPETAEDMQRLEWQTMLASVLNGDVLRSEKTRIGRVLESYEAQRINRLELWQELRARPRGRTVEQEKQILEEKRRRTVGPFIEEILNFRIVSLEPEGDDDDDSPTVSDFQRLMSANHSPLKQVASLLRRWDAAESLYPNLKAMRQDYPDAGSERFLRRLDTLNSWHTVVTAIRSSIETLKQLMGSESLDLAVPMLDDPPEEVQSPRKPNGAIGDRQQPESTTFVERILKEDGFQRTFERGAVVDLQDHVHNARMLVLTFSDTLEEMNIPTFTDDLITIITFPTQLMEQLLRVRLAIAQQVAEPSMLTLDQMLDDFRLAIGLACTVKNDYEELMRPEGMWQLPPCIGPDYEEVVLAALRFFFKLIHQKLKSAHKSIYFKETELLEAQWYILEEVTMATRGGGLLVAEHVCSVTNKLILRVITSFQGQIQAPAYTMPDEGAKESTNIAKYPRATDGQRKTTKQPEDATPEDTIRWFAKVLDGVRLRHRKLQRYSRLLTSRFANAAEYSLEGANTTDFMDTLVKTEHFLVYTEFYESQGLYIVGDPGLYHSPETVRQMLSKAFHVSRRAAADAFDVDGSDVQSENDDTDDNEDGHYLLVMTPQDNFVWRGIVLVLSMPTMELEMRDMTARLIATSPSRLDAAKDKFASYFVDPEDEARDEEEYLEPPLEVLTEQMAHLPPVNRELRKISRATQKLAETIVDSVHEVKKTLAGVDGAQELMENWFLFASEHGQAALRTMDHQAQVRLSRLLTRLSISWVAFICDSCDPTDRKTFRWAVNALEFAMVRTRGTNILQLPEADFRTLQQKVASCMTLLVSHFDILGARSSYEEKERERERERQDTASASGLGSNSFVEDGMGRLTAAEELVTHAPQDASVRAFYDRLSRNIANIDVIRDEILIEQHAAGRVLMTEGAEDESLAFLASTASKTTIRWQQGRFIAAGAFGSVYLALNLETGGVMAAKEIRFKNSTSLSTLYQQVKDELAVMEVLHHPNIVEYYGLEVHRDKVYIFEEYCSGGTLTALLESGRIEDEMVVKIYTMQMLEGLMYLHSMGVVHRDIKPDNILLDQNGIIKFVDFGAAKILAKNKGSIQAGRSLAVAPPSNAAGGLPAIPGIGVPMTSLTGTPMYMSPEVIKSDRRSRKGAMDIWSMGCVVLECVTGRKPWSNLDNEWAIMFHIGIATQHPPLPEPGQLGSMGIDFIRQCLTIDGVKRPTATELYDHPWILEFREELAAYEQENIDIPQTPSLVNSSLRTDFSESLGNSMSPGSREKLYEGGMISPPGVFGDTGMIG